MVLYFFTMAGSVWWVILTITWFLAAVPKWGSEAIEKKALLFHACAWGIPGILTVSLLAMNKIEGDSVSGVCFVGLYNLTALRWFLLVPLGLDVVVRIAPGFPPKVVEKMFNLGRIWTGGRGAAAGRYSGSEPSPDGDPTGEGEPGETGEVHDPDRRLLRSVPAPPAGRAGLLHLREQLPGRVGDHLGPREVPRLPHPLPLQGVCVCV